jgi:hypothetical protein
MSQLVEVYANLPGLERRAVRTAEARWQAFAARSPEAIVRHVRLWDWWTASAVTFVTVFAFLLARYGDDFDTWQDYAEVFTAGSLGQLGGAAILWNLFPPFRSYRAGTTTVAA